MPDYKLVPVGKGGKRLALETIELNDVTPGRAKAAAREMRQVTGIRMKVVAKKNPSMKLPKLGKWISAAKVRLVKKNGVKVLEIRRTVKKRTTRTNKARKRKR